MAEMEKLHFEAVAAQHAGCGDVLYFEEGLSPDSVRRLSVLLAASCGGQAAVFSGEGSDYKYALTGPQGTSMKEFTAAMNSALNGKGGGRENFAQGSVKASRKQIETYFHGN